MSERLNIKNMLVEPEQPTSLTMETVTSRVNSFVMETLKGHWMCDVEEMSIAQQNIGSTTEPLNTIDYTAKKSDQDINKLGQYTLNPDTATINWETIDPNKLTILDLPTMRGKPMVEVIKHIIDTYGSTHHIPGLEYLQYILEHPDKMSDQMKHDTPQGQHSNAYLTPGSLVRNREGHWCVLQAEWISKRWELPASSVVERWQSNYRVMLLDRQYTSSTFQPDETPPLPNQRNF